MTEVIATAAPVNLHDFTRGAAILPHARDYLARKDRILTDDQLRKLAPSIFADAPSSHMSDRYLFIPTSRIVEGLRREGFAPVHALQSNARTDEGAIVAKHVIRFRHQSATALARVGDTFPEIVVTNSHDGASGFGVMAGLMRLACSNGLVVSSGTIGEVRVRHTGRALDDVIEGSYRVIEETPKLAGIVERMAAVTLEQPHILALANAAKALRWHEGEHCPIDRAADLVQVRRTADRDPNLWNVLNRIQEAIIKGGVAGHNSTGKRYTTRAVGGVAENIKLNREIWALGEEALEVLA